MSAYRITIGDPQKQGDGLNAFISYKVTSQMSEKVAGLDGQVYTVVRRFNDFVWLRNQIRDILPYLIVPSLPEKQQMGRFNTDFVDVRLRALQRWVDRISSHPEVVNTESFRKFISFPAEAFAALRDGARVDKVKGVAEEGKKTVMKMMKNAQVVVQGAINQARGTPSSSAASSGTSRSVEDMSFAELEAYLLGQAPLLTALYNEAAGVAVRAREQAQLLLDFGAALRALGQSESDSPLGNCLNLVGVASWAASTASYEQAVCETELFVEKLADYVRLTRSVKECVESRGKASSELAEATGEVERLRALIVALGAGPTTAQSVASKAQAEVDLQIAQKIAAETRAFYDKSAAGVLTEVDRLRVGMVVDFKGMCMDFIAVQIRTELKLSAAWDKITAETAAGAAATGGVVPGGAQNMGGGGGGGGFQSY